MKLKIILSIICLFGLFEVQGQNLETDSIFKYKYRNLKHLRKDVERAKTRTPNKKTKWEYDHYHVNVTDSTVRYSKTKAGIVMDFTIIDQWKEESTHDFSWSLLDFERFISAVDKCGNKIWINCIPADFGLHLIIYYQEKNLKYYSVNMFFPIEYKEY